MTDAKICHLLDLWSNLYLVYKYENASFRKRLIGYSCDELYKLCVSVVYILNICSGGLPYLYMYLLQNDTTYYYII